MALARRAPSLAALAGTLLLAAPVFAQAPPAPAAPVAPLPAPEGNLPAVEAPRSPQTPGDPAGLPPPPPEGAPGAVSAAPQASGAPAVPAVPAAQAMPGSPEVQAAGGALPLQPTGAVVAPLGPRRVSLWPQRLRLLNATLPPLAARSRGARILDGVLNLVVGTGVGVVGFFVPSSGSVDQRPFFWALGGIQAAQGILTLAWAPARETLTAQYVGMPMNTARERRLRVRFGERSLDEIAADGARRRVLQAVVGALAPVLLLGVMYREQIFNRAAWSPNGFDALMIGLTVLSSGVALIPLFGRSEDERLREQYQQQVRLMRAERGLPP